MTARGIIFRSAFTFAPGGSDPRLVRWRRALATACARTRLAAWRRHGDQVLAIGDDDAGLPAGVTFLPQRTFLPAAGAAPRVARAAWLAAGWYRATDRNCAAELCSDGIDLCSALEAEKMRTFEATLERADLLLAAQAQHPGVRWYADSSATDLTRCPELSFAPLLPAVLQAQLRRLEMRYRAGAIRRDFMTVPATGTRPRPGAHTLVFPLFGLNRQGLRNQLPHLKLLADDPRQELLVVAPLPELVPLLTEELGGQARFVSWNDYWTPALEQRALARWRRLYDRLAHPGMQERRQAQYHYRGINLLPALADADAFLHGPLAREIMRYAAFTEELLAREKPAVLMLSLDSGWRERALVDVARRAGVPTVCQHNAQVAPYPDVASLRTLDPPAGDAPPRLHWQVVSDRATLIGESMRDRLVAGGCDPAGLRVAGLSRYDGFAARRAALHRDRERARLQVPDGMRVAVLTTQPPSQIDGSTRADRNRAARAVADAAAAAGGVFLLIKPHPEELDEAYAAILAAAGTPGRVVSALEPLFPLLAAADLLITYFSTSAFEAMAMDVPVLTVNVCGRPDVLPYAAAGAAVGVYALEEIAGGVRRALTPDPARAAAARAFLAQTIDMREGAARRCTAAVTELLPE